MLDGRTILCLLIVALWPATASADLQQSVGPLLQKHCFACHGPNKQEADLRFDGLTGNLTAHPAEANIWSAILEQLETGAMPPEERPRPAAGDIAAATAWIKQNVWAGPTPSRAQDDAAGERQLCVA